jgi:D-glycero-alpha-D-manno-heptose-7-phosphate kinase
VTPQALAEQACEIEIEILGEPVGKQDQYVAAHGGICTYTFHRNDSVTVEPLELPESTLTELRNNLLLFYTGASRSSSGILADQVARTREGNDDMLENLKRIKDIGYESARLLRDGDLFAYAELMHEHWQLKRQRSPGMTDEHIDELYTLARRSGVVGGKLVGAGGGGFLLVYARRPDDTRQAMTAAGVSELVFDFDSQGARGQAFL